MGYTHPYGARVGVSTVLGGSGLGRRVRSLSVAAACARTAAPTCSCEIRIRTNKTCNIANIRNEHSNELSLFSALRQLGGCYFCHDIMFNPRARDHNSRNCTDPRNAWGIQASTFKTQHVPPHAHQKAPWPHNAAHHFPAAAPAPAPQFGSSSQKLGQIKHDAHAKLLECCLNFPERELGFNSLFHTALSMHQ
jgi:hypothetical protein